MEDEESSLFHILKMVKLRETRVIRQVLDMQSNDICGHRNILNTFPTHLRQKYEPIEIDHTCVIRLQRVIPLTCPTKYAEPLEQPITIEELLSALRSGAKHKTPGIDSFRLEFYIVNWDTIK